MKKRLLLPSILLTYMFLSTSCIQKQSIYTDDRPYNNRSTTNSETIAYTPEPTNNNYPSSSSTISGTTHQFPTIQGDSITIIENGNVGFDFPQYRGKIIVFQIFGKDCEYCIEEMPTINRINNHFSNRVKVIGIQAQGRMSPSIASNILQQHNINYPIIEGDDAKELLGFIADTYAWRGILPYTLLIKDGTTEYTFPDGGVSYQELKESIDSLL
jgi:thiol-disulfide isomerase/thioredoxin